MVFTSFSYLLLFLPIVILGVYCFSKISNYLSLIWTVVASLFFYTFWKSEYLPLLLVSIAFNYSCGYLIQKQGKIWLILGIIFNISILGYFKYTNFLVDTVNMLIEIDWHVNTIILPLALSFFTFQQIAWLVDQFRKQAPPCRFSEYICAVSFFPHLIAGPIIHYHDLIPQLQSKKAFKADWDLVAKGLFLIACGVFKKIVLADTLSVYVAYGFDQSASLSFLQAWIAALSYSMQIYFDFSGYCDIAIGSALLFSIRLPDNFHSPYKAASISEFWQRWHITLGTFLTRYLYIPLGGSRKGLARTCINILLIMLISGIWHGAGFGFILWGIMHGTAMVIQRLWNAAGFALPRFMAIMPTFLFVTFAWVLFRATSLEAASKVYNGLFGQSGIVLPHELADLFPVSWNISFASSSEIFGLEMTTMQPILLVLAACFIFVYGFKELLIIWEGCVIRHPRLTWILMCGSALLLLVAFLKMAMIPYSEFIYFNF